MRVLTVATEKGGAGKTSAVVNLASALAELGERVLVVDCDPQGNLTEWLGAKPDPETVSVFTGRGSLEARVQETTVEGVDIIGADSSLLQADPATAGKPARELLLRRAVEALPDRWSFVLLDPPPSTGFLSLSAISAAREIVIPVEPGSPFGVSGLAGLLETVEELRGLLGADLQVLGVLVTRAGRTRLSREVVQSLRAELGELVFQAEIPDTVKVGEAATLRRSVIAHAPRHAVSEAYRALAREIRGKKGD